MILHEERELVLLQLLRRGAWGDWIQCMQPSGDTNVERFFLTEWEKKRLMFLAASWDWAWGFALPNSRFLRPVQRKWVMQMYLAGQVQWGKQVPPHGGPSPPPVPAMEEEQNWRARNWGDPARGKLGGWEEDGWKDLLALCLTVVVSAPLPPNTGHPEAVVSNAKTKRPMPRLFAQKHKPFLQACKR